MTAKGKPPRLCPARSHTSSVVIQYYEVNSEVKDTLHLKFFFDYFRQIPPPPPPPEQKNLNNVE